MSRARLLGGLLLAALLAGPAAAQRSDYEEIRPPRFPALESSEWHGKKIQVSFVKFLGLSEDKQQLLLDGGYEDEVGKRESPLNGRLLILDSDLRDRLATDRDSARKSLEPSVSNIQLKGVGRRTVNGLMLVVRQVRWQRSWKDTYESLSKDAKYQGATGRLKLIAQIEANTRYYPADQEALAELLGQLRQEARDAEYPGLAALPGGAQARIAAGQRHADIELLAEVWAHPEVAPDQREAAATALEELRAHRYLGRWVAHEEFKGLLGFVRTEDRRWVPRERLWLLEEAEREKDRLRKKVPRQQITGALLEEAMQRGEIVRGMPKKMVLYALNAAANASEQAFPLRVERVRERVSSKGEEVELVHDMWLMPDGQRIFFCNDWMTEKETPTERPGPGPPAPTPTPAASPAEDGGSQDAGQDPGSGSGEGAGEGSQ